MGSGNGNDILFTVSLNNSYGADICGDAANEMIWTLPGTIIDHRASSVTISIQAPDQGIFVNDLELYLGNCDQCAMIGLSY